MCRQKLNTSKQLFFFSHSQNLLVMLLTRTLRLVKPTLVCFQLPALTAQAKPVMGVEPALQIPVLTVPAATMSTREI